MSESPDITPQDPDIPDEPPPPEEPEAEPPASE